MNLKYKTLAITSITLINILLLMSVPSDSKPVVKTLQKSPNGIYVYGSVRLRKQGGAMYIIIKKQGRNFVSSGYIYQSDGGCSSGTISGNTLNERRVYRGMEDEKGIVKTNSQTNLSNLYKLSPTVEDREGVQGCIDIMNK